MIVAVAARSAGAEPPFWGLHNCTNTPQQWSVLRAAAVVAVPLLLLPCRLLTASDLFCLANAVLTSCMLIRTFGTGSNSGMTWHYQLPMILYGVMNVTQLALLLLKPELYQRYRFQVGVLGGGVPNMGGCDSVGVSVGA
jgi:hypothetical protein